MCTHTLTLCSGRHNYYFRLRGVFLTTQRWCLPTGSSQDGLGGGSSLGPPSTGPPSQDPLTSQGPPPNTFSLGVRVWQGHFGDRDALSSRVSSRASPGPSRCGT